MQTFLPYKKFGKSLLILDRNRLNSQRRESLLAWKILNGITDGGKYKYHPIIKMWKGYENALAVYYNLSLLVWEIRGYKNIKLKFVTTNRPIQKPDWLNESFCSNHRSILLGKNFEYYKRFQWKEKPAQMINNKWPYIWPI
ncbi:MAG: pyrimidine dimer DNA glycosylase/endonuclease V [Bacteroidales bacterium]|nr:pyrimidine dimer DNA glycosylase/endonuclease V [Bacteroidales bacterium]